MNRRFFISSSIAFGGVALLTRLPGWAQSNDWRIVRGGQTNADEDVRAPKGDAALKSPDSSIQDKSKSKGIKEVIKTDAEWKAQLTPEQYNVLREKGTDYAGTSPYTDLHDKGTFECAGCGLPLFSSEQKFDSGTGWPSFWAPIKKENVIEEVDRSHGMTRTEVLCAQCDGHLGHLFDDGPNPTGLRYCMNGVALKFVKG
jgi:peptide-methionine (R)-S-oxide reductase